ncbi:hypothetical protein [Nonomuraea sp. NPDC049646]|uniref:hypothetical protein n=1 Tax=unclassified Nonomuraea TaxID=2593643 RepID=UPI00378B5558
MTAPTTPGDRTALNPIDVQAAALQRLSDRAEAIARDVAALTARLPERARAWWRLADAHTDAGVLAHNLKRAAAELETHLHAHRHERGGGRRSTRDGMGHE